MMQFLNLIEEFTMAINDNNQSEMFPLIERSIDNNPITQRAFDGYVNATAL